MCAHRLVGMALIIVLLSAVGTLALKHRESSLGRDHSILVTWTSGGLPEGFAAAVSHLDSVSAASVVRGDLLGLVASWDAEGRPIDQPPDDMTVPLDALAIDPQAHAAVVDGGHSAAVRSLEQGDALLGKSSARLRGLGKGAVMELATGQRVTVAGVVPDDLVAHAELLLPAPAPGVRTQRFVRLLHAGERTEMERAIRGVGREAGDVEIRGPGEQSILRHGGSLWSQVAVKTRFGEFAYRPAGGRSIVQDEAWVEAHIRVARVPILGEVACHREMLPALEGAMTALVDAGLASLVNPADYAGCYAPRLISPEEALSRHAWGIAVDLNATTNAYGEPPMQDHRLVDTMARWGFRWGGTWRVPDGMHFEYLPSDRPGG